MAEKTENYEEVCGFLLSCIRDDRAENKNAEYVKKIEHYIARLQKRDVSFSCRISVIHVICGVQILDFEHCECLTAANCERAVRDLMRSTPAGIEMSFYFEDIYCNVIAEFLQGVIPEQGLCCLRGARAGGSCGCFGRTIGSKKDEAVSEFKKYSTLKSRIDGEHFVVEGMLVARRAVLDHQQVEKVICCDNSDGEQLTELMELCRKHSVACYKTSPGIMATLTSTRPVPEVIASVRSRVYSQKELILSGRKNFFLILDRIANPDNLGMVLRTADAAGVHAVILLSESTHFFNKNAIRGARGAVGRIPLYYCTDDFELMDRLSAHGFQIIGTSARFEAANFYDMSYDADHIAIVVGNESSGVRREILDRCTDYVKIPMVEGQSSLNIAVASALMLYEYNRNQLGSKTV